MKIQSKLSWKFFAILSSVGLTIVCCIFLLFIFLDTTKKVPYEVLVLPTVLLVIAFTLLLMLIRSIKTISIENDKIQIRFLFGKTYMLNSLVGYKELISRDKFGEYKTFYFKTESKIFRLGNREFSNYDALSDSIINRTQPSEISIFYEGKLILIILFVTSGIVVTIIGIVNQ